MLELLRELERVNAQYKRNLFVLLYDGDEAYIGVLMGNGFIAQCTSVVSRSLDTELDGDGMSFTRHKHLSLLRSQLCAIHNTRQFFDPYAGERAEHE